MNRYILLLIILLVGCTAKKKVPEEIRETISETETENSAIDSVTLTEEEPEIDDKVNNEGPETASSDCIFDDDYKGLTSDWLEELSISNYTWKDELNGALIPFEKDTVFISKGGCYHFGYLVEIRIHDEQISVTDSLTIISKAGEIANRFGMHHYSKMINEGRLTKTQNETFSIWFGIPDDDVDDNLYYTGIKVSFEGLKKTISISKYIN